MLCEDKTLPLIDIFIVCDDFCNALTDSEMLAITISYHYSEAKCFE